MPLSRSLAVACYIICNTSSLHVLSYLGEIIIRRVVTIFWVNGMAE